jgi:hypothetical protein
VYTAASATIPSTLSVATSLRSVRSGTSRRLLQMHAAADAWNESTKQEAWNETEEAKEQEPSPLHLWGLHDPRERMQWEDFERVAYALDWSEASSPCRELVQTFANESRSEPAQVVRTLGPLELERVHACVFWRFVGSETVRLFNLSETVRGYDSFLISSDDFIYVASRTDLVMKMVGSPRMLLHIAVHHPWTQTLEATLFFFLRWIKRVQWMHAHNVAAANATLGGNESEEDGDLLRSMLLWDPVALVPPTSPSWDLPPPASPEPNLTRARTRHGSDNLTHARTRHGSDNLTHDATNQSSPARRLLWVQEQQAALEAYSARVAAAAEGQAPTVLDQGWGRDARQWGPSLWHDLSLQSCPAAQVTLNVSRVTLTVLVEYYRTFNASRPQPDRGFLANLPKFPSWSNLSAGRQAIASRSASWSSWLLHALLGLAGARVEDLTRFFGCCDEWTLGWIVETSVRCDFQGIVTCSGHTRDLLMSLAVFAIVYFIVHFVASAVALPSLATLFLLSLPAFVLWYTYGVSVQCLPMLPPCLLEDVIWTVQRVLPASLELPADLVCNQSLAGTNATTCLKSCAELNYTTWADPLAFTACDASLDWCLALAGIQGNLTGWGTLDAWLAQLSSPMRDSLLRKAAVVARGGDLGGQRFCTLVTWVNVLPVLFGALALAVTALYGVYALVHMVPLGVHVAIETLLYHQSGAG